MKIKELKNRGKSELENSLKEKKEMLSRLSFDLSSGKVKNVKEIRAVRKDIARILTLLNQK